MQIHVDILGKKKRKKKSRKSKKDEEQPDNNTISSDDSPKAKETHGTVIPVEPLEDIVNQKIEITKEIITNKEDESNADKKENKKEEKKDEKEEKEEKAENKDMNIEEENKDIKINKDIKGLGYPVIVKPVNLGSSVGIEIAKEKEELQEAIENAFVYAKKILVEKAITKLKEVNCSVVGDYEEAIPSECEEPVKTEEILSFTDKYISGGKKTGGRKLYKI